MISKPHVVIIGGGFAGLNAAKLLKQSPVTITLIDKANHHLFQPLLYQVATSALSPHDIAVPLRSIFRTQSNVRVMMGEVDSINKEEKTVHLTDGAIFSYDYCIVATGSRHAYFGHEEWEYVAPGLKTLGDALIIRERILLAFERAERLNDTKEQEKFLTFVVIGAGPTGVEMAGAIAEIATKSMRKNFRNIDPAKAKVILVEGGKKVLAPYPDSLSEIAKEDLENLGVKVLLNTVVTHIETGIVKVGDTLIESANIIWAAGNMASPFLKTLETEQDKMGRVVVTPHLYVPEYPELFVIGDCAFVKDYSGPPLPGIAPVAMQQGKYVSKVIQNRLLGKATRPFAYLDKGKMATIGRARAVVDIPFLKLSGLIAWLIWSFIHILFLINFKNKIIVLFEWAISFINNNKAVRLITGREKNPPSF